MGEFKSTLSGKHNKIIPNNIKISVASLFSISGNDITILIQTPHTPKMHTPTFLVFLQKKKLLLSETNTKEGEN